ncbi:MAG: DNA glycosylase AlkZ-like family protein [Bacteroides cellulosilyticus]
MARQTVPCAAASRRTESILYALTCERIPDAIELSHEEALAELTRRYFRSHGPATLEDFVWWSALNIGEARNAIASLGTEMITERYNDREMLIHASSPGLAGEVEIDERNVFQFLPPFDEYLVSYKNRLDCSKGSAYEVCL